MEIFISYNNIDGFISEIKEIAEEYKDEIEEQVANLAKVTYNRAIDLAKSKAKTTQQDYINALDLESHKDKNGITYVLSLKEEMLKYEDGFNSFDMKCLVDSKIKIQTSKGKIRIADIKKDDLVLTHNGKMQRVLQTYCEENKDEYIIQIKTKRSFISVTCNHPILTQNGWKRADELNEINDKIIVLAKQCKVCGKLFEYSNKDHCSKKCSAHTSNEFRRIKGRIDLNDNARKKISKAVIETNKRLAREGKHASQPGGKLYLLSKGNPEWGYGSLTKKELQIYQHKAAIALGKSSHFSDPESVLWERMCQEGLDSIFKRQQMFKRDNYKKSRYGKMIPRWYCLDFANNDLKISIEVNGERWHTPEQVELKTKEIEGKGWRCLNFWSKQIYHNLDACIEEIKNVLKNHNNEYIFTSVNFKIFKKKKSKFAFFKKYNITVENDNSFIANTIVTHNSGLLAGPNAKVSANGNRYNTVPFSHHPYSKASASKSTVKIQQSAQKAIERYGLNKIIKGSNNKAIIGKAGTIKNASYNANIQGLTKYQAKVGKTIQSTYKTFRRVSDASDSNSWIHPGFAGFHIFDDIAMFVEEELENIINNIIK